jgi:hypothetical protein
MVSVMHLPRCLLMEVAIDLAAFAPDIAALGNIREAYKEVATKQEAEEQATDARCELRFGLRLWLISQAVVTSTKEYIELHDHVEVC